MILGAPRAAPFCNRSRAADHRNGEFIELTLMMDFALAYRERMLILK